MMRHLMGRTLRYVFATSVVAAIASSGAYANPYASGVVNSGTSVSFTLNQPAAGLTYTVNGGAPQSLDGTTKGLKTFSIPSGATFSISATDSEATGWMIPVAGGTIPVVASTGLSQISNQAGTNIISDDTSPLVRFSTPRGVSVSQNPNTSNFGTAYIMNSAAGALTGGNVVGPNTAVNSARTLTGKGLYALKADGSDAYGNVDAAVNPQNIDGVPAFATAANSFGTGLTNSGYRINVANDGTIYAADYSDNNGQLFQVQPNLTGVATTSVNIFAGYGGPAPPVGPPTTADGTALGPDPACALNGCTTAFQNHGSISSSVVSGSLAAGNLTVYTLDEDLDSAHFGGTGANAQSDRNSVWKYTVGSSIPSGGYNGTPTQLAPGVPTPAAPTVPNGLIGDFPPGGINADMTRGPDGKFYLMQDRSAGNQPGLLVYDSTGQNVLFNSLQTSKTLLNDPNAVDILTGAGGVDVSPDDKYVAVLLLDNDIAIMKLNNGIPDLGNRTVVDGGSNSGSARDIAFDAADNLYTVSSGTGMYRVMSPGGNSTTTLSWNGTTYAFSSAISTTPAGIAGDYNGNGVVDMADYVLWRASVGQSTLTNRGTGISGPVGQADYDFWRAHFGNTSGAGSSLGGSAVPEPGSLALVLIGLLSAGGCRKRSA